jgi:hypothetical protein
VDLSFDDLGPESYLGVDMMFESDESLRIECSTTVILKGRQVVEKIQVEEGRRALGKTLFELKDSVMCDVMVEFIEKLRSVDTPAVVNTVLENFSVLQVSVCTTFFFFFFFFFPVDRALAVVLPQTHPCACASVGGE